ncbi:hypothetical protein MRX96_003863 [Rhipicephalus microplus]
MRELPSSAERRETRRKGCERHGCTCGEVVWEAAAPAASSLRGSAKLGSGSYAGKVDGRLAPRNETRRSLFNAANCVARGLCRVRAVSTIRQRIPAADDRGARVVADGENRQTDKERYCQTKNFIDRRRTLLPEHIT